MAEVGGSILGKCNFQKKKRKVRGDNVCIYGEGVKKVGRVVGREKQGEVVTGGVHEEEERGGGKSPF